MIYDFLVIVETEAEATRLQHQADQIAMYRACVCNVGSSKIVGRRAKQLLVQYAPPRTSAKWRHWKDYVASAAWAIVPKE